MYPSGRGGYQNVLRDRSTSGEETARVDACLRYLPVKKPQMRGAWLRTLDPMLLRIKRRWNELRSRSGATREEKDAAAGPREFGQFLLRERGLRALHATAPLRRLLLQEAKMDADAPVSPELRKLAALLSGSTRPYVRGTVP